ncbi:MAG TPA: DUF3857 domain-containing protein [Cyclobacteriaceae bacterium]|nr:transglutaminase-like domain-containing protein [Cyclobacteriaceae bacterium]HMV07862.1 DUF3857 domain-containing protein [Cyclobacteriaceae bacterium]HMV88130.1 DUF3857 domain-containing protein [Cyclobacteriaceae bacterium]HMW98996.1 DUF3857 domain-containing protein [Cyclobacteriaceae bacterium]HMX48370.1 DUF3857 domain-containing protein [Cyclobacteriaceae bacterium]
MKSVLVIIWLLVCILPAFGQKDPMKFGDIAMEDLTMTSYAKDSSAEAIILSDFGKVSPTGQFSMMYERHVRIKILKANGTGWADQAIQLPIAGTNGENKFQFKASTFNLEGGKIVETALPKESMFREKFTRGIELQKFTFQDVKVGSVLEYSYSIISPGLPTWQFQKKIPTRLSEFWAITPATLVFKHFSRGYIQASTYDAKESAAETSYHWIYRDVPAFRPEPFMSSEEDFIGEIEFFLTKVSSGYTLELMGTWEKVNELLFKSEFVGGHIAGNPFLKPITKNLTEGKSDPMERVSVIYDYVKNKYTWEKRYAVGSRTLKESFEKGIGTCSDINLTLASMLDKADFKVNVVALSTRDNGMIRKQVAMPYQFNYLICAVQVENRIILLDATEKHLPLGYLPERCLNGEGFMLDKENFGWIPTDFLPISKTVTSSDIKLDGNGNVEGKITFTRDGYDALDFRKVYTEKGEEEYLKYFSNKMGWEFEQHNFENIDDLNKSTKETYSVRIDNHASGSADILYVNPILCERLGENPFTADDRKYPISYGKTFESIYMSRITVPDGYIVEEIPAPLVIKLPDNSAKYTYSITQNSNVLSILSHFKIGKTLYVQSEYLQLKELYNQVVAKQAEQIVLKKK